MYAVWINIDETLPWIELEGTYPSKSEARRAAKTFLKNVKMKVVNVGSERKPMKAVVTVKR